VSGTVPALLPGRRRVRSCSCA